MAIWSEVVYTVCWNATRGIYPEQDISALLPVAEALMPSVFQHVGEDAAGDERKRSLLKQNVSLSFTSGSATLPDYVLSAYMEDATFTDNDDLTKTYSWVREFGDFISPSLQNPPWSNLGYFNVVGRTTIRQIEPGAAYSPTTGITDTRILNIPCIPVKPASESAEFDVPDEVLSDIYEIAAEALRGQLMKQAAANT